MSEIKRTPVKVVAVGLDMSLAGTGFCLKRGQTIMVDTIKTTTSTASNDLARLRYIVDKVIGMIPNDVNMICIEDFFTPANKAQLGSAIKLAMLGAIIRLALYELGYPFFVVAPSQIKKFVTGKGTAPKSIIVREVYKRWGIEAKDDNQADACTMAYVAEALLCWAGPDTSLVTDSEIPKFQKEVIKKILDDRPRYNV